MAALPTISRKTVRLTAFILLLFHFCLALASSQRDGAVADEPFHLARGAGLVFYRDSSFAVSHPPLVNFLSGLPLLTVSGLELPDPGLVLKSRAMDPSDRRNAFAVILLKNLNPDAKQLIERARISTMLLSVALGLLVFVWAKQIYGPKAGLLALFLYSLDPNILAHCRLITNDLGAAFFICLALYFFWRLWKEPKALNLALAALGLGLAELSKFSAVLLYPLYPLIWAALLLRMKKDRPEMSWLSLKRPDSFRGLWGLSMIFVSSLLVVWAGYGFEYGTTWNFSALASGELCRLTDLSAQIKCAAVKWLDALPLLPRTFYYGLARTLVLTEQHENALYFMGATGSRGWWYYYPALFLIKTPLPLLILLTLRVAWRKEIRGRDFTSSLVLTAPVIVFGLFFILLNRKEIGIRHLLMIYPLLFVFISGLAQDEVLAKAPKKIVLALLMVWLATSSLMTWPHYLTYFSEAVGRSRGGLKISVVGEDWGQDVSSLARLQKERGLRPLYYQPYVLVSPDSWGLEYRDVNCEPLQAGYYAVHLTQLKRPVRDPELAGCIEVLKSSPPEYKVNGTIWVWKTKGATSGPAQP